MNRLLMAECIACVYSGKCSEERLAEYMKDPFCKAFIETIQELEIATLQQLTPTQKKVALLIGKSLTYKEVAFVLNVSYSTISEHIKRIYKAQHSQ